MRSVLTAIFSALLACGQGHAAEERIEILDVDVISYEAFTSSDPRALAVLKKALYEKGIAGIRGIPGYKEKVLRFIESARKFSALPEEIKEKYAPDRSLGETFLGYERGKERFKRPDGKWVVDDLKVSYYAFVPDCAQNRWPREVNLRDSFLDLGNLMSETAASVMKKIGLLKSSTGVHIDGVPRVGRLLYYRKSSESRADNPYWCGAHFDNGIFTALLPAFYFVAGKAIPEPKEAGLFVRANNDAAFKKVVADDPDVMLFQVGEFGQLAAHDAIRATEHRVHKAQGAVERYTMALFFSAAPDDVIYSSSVLAQDARYGKNGDGSCTFKHWSDESFKRYIVKEDTQ